MHKGTHASAIDLVASASGRTVEFKRRAEAVSVGCTGVPTGVWNRAATPSADGKALKFCGANSTGGGDARQRDLAR